MTTRKTRPEASLGGRSPRHGQDATEEWFAILDAAGARDMTHKDIAAMLQCCSTTYRRGGASM